MSCTRRTFLERVGQAGGGAAVHGAMRALGLVGAPALAWSPPAVRAPAGTRVIILGAGVAGLAAAYELRKLGYDSPDAVKLAVLEETGHISAVGADDASQSVTPERLNP